MGAQEATIGTRLGRGMKALGTWRRILIGTAILSLALASLPSGAAERGRHFARSGYEGLGAATMETVATPARIGRLAVIPGTDETWAIGHSSAAVPGWDRASPGGQVLFLTARPGRQWSIVSTPRNLAGAVFNPTLYAFGFAASGEGWAVGDGGVVLHRSAGNVEWRQHAQAKTVAAAEQLNAVSVAPAGPAYAYAAGSDSFVMRYDGEMWIREQPQVMLEDGNPDLTAVATVSRDEAWAITGSGSNDLRVYHRTAAGWERVDPDQSVDSRLFAGPHPAKGDNGGVNHAAFGASVAADSSGAWVGGAMFPGDAVQLSGDETTGDRSRPFVLRFTDGGHEVTSYCPDQFRMRQESSGQKIDQARLCDEPFPASAFDVTSISLLPGGEIFAGGLGLYRFKAGGWFREPNTIGYIISTAFSSATEGWVATTGDTYGAGTAIFSSESVLGHWTDTPQRPRIARWPQPQMQPLQAVAVAPDGSGRALAVGEEGAVVSYAPGVGWDHDVRVTTKALHAVAWQDRVTAWAVGEFGVIQRYDGRAWAPAPESGKLTTNGLFGVAFSRSGTGVAIGAEGTILRFDGARWSRDPGSGVVTDEDLYAVSSGPSGTLAVGANGTIVEAAGEIGQAAWTRRSHTARNFSRPDLGGPPLYAVAHLDNGDVVAGGERSALLVRRGGGDLQPIPTPVEGTILSIGAGRDRASGRLHLVAAVSPDARKYRGDRLAATLTSVLAFDGTGWSDLHLGRRRSIYPTADAGEYVDPVYAVAMEPGGTSGWAVGGFPAHTPDEEGHIRLDPTSSVYRFDLAGDPRPPFTQADVRLPAGGFNFAFFAETWCGQGLCSIAKGTGIQADVVPLAIQREINRAVSMPNGPSFVMFAGNGRAAGIPDELGEQKAFLERFAVPVYGAPGNKDLFTGLDDSIARQVVETAGQRSGGSAFWKEIFASMQAPWGERPSPRGMTPVVVPGPAPDIGLARTHYAFDVQPGARKLARIIVIDSSTRSYGQPADQNPRESQGDWLQAVLTAAKLENGGKGVPTVIVMNQPSRFPDITPRLNWTRDQVSFEGTVVAQAVSAVLTGGIRMNIKDFYPNSSSPVKVPLYVLGTGGAPLGYELPDPDTRPASKLPSDGFYHAWFLVNVDPDVLPEEGVAGQAKVTVTPFPLLDSIALHAIDGHVQEAGKALRFSALARGMTGGGSDPEQSKTTYYPIGNSTLVPCEGPGQGRGVCRSNDALTPPYRFYSEDPSIADFAYPDFAKGDSEPLRVGGVVRRDPAGEYGLLCTFKRGTTYVNVVSGFQRARMKVTVDGGFGPCVDKPVPKPPVVVELPPEPRVKAVRVEVPPPRPHPQPELIALFPPPPAPVVAPAPPGAPGVGRKEEHEVEYETETHDDAKHSATALSHDAVKRASARETTDARSRRYAFSPARRSAADPASQAWPLLGGVLVMSFALAAAAAAVRQRVIEPARQRRGA